MISFIIFSSVASFTNKNLSLVCLSLCYSVGSIIFSLWILFPFSFLGSVGVRLVSLMRCLEPCEYSGHELTKIDGSVMILLCSTIFSLIRLKIIFVLCFLLQNTELMFLEIPNSLCKWQQMM